MTDVVLIYSTFPSLEDARRIAEDAVESRYAACANIFPGVQSIYEYNNEFSNTTENMVIFKTTKAKQDAAIAHIKHLHPFDEPALLAVPITGGDPAYLNWIARQTA